MRGALVVSLMGVLLVSAASASPQSTGLHGYVFRSPSKPSCRLDEPCKAAVSDAKVTFTAVADRTTFVVEGRTTGFYRIALPAGVYTVRVKGTRTGRGIPVPARVRVRAGADGRIDFVVDSGIQ